ncbi:MAG: hypothetical protein WA549_05325 [Thermoplasmata archaeon]
MTNCADCGAVIGSDPRPAIRSGPQSYHLTCAPAALLAEAQDEYEAILRKGVRYFLEKYHVGPTEAAHPGPQFVALGSAIATERTRRASR